MNKGIEHMVFIIHVAPVANAYTRLENVKIILDTHIGFDTVSSDWIINSRLGELIALGGPVAHVAHSRLTP